MLLSKSKTYFVTMHVSELSSLNFDYFSVIFLNIKTSKSKYFKLLQVITYKNPHRLTKLHDSLPSEELIRRGKFPLLQHLDVSEHTASHFLNVLEGPVYGVTVPLGLQWVDLLNPGLLLTNARTDVLQAVLTVFTVSVDLLR